jgi:hypothetical protein
MDHRSGSYFAFHVWIFRSRLGDLDWFVLLLMPKEDGTRTASQLVGGRHEEKEVAILFGTLPCG